MVLIASDVFMSYISALVVKLIVGLPFFKINYKYFLQLLMWYVVISPNKNKKDKRA